MAKGYNRENFLLRVIKMKAYFNEHYVRGMTMTHAHKYIIKPKFDISKKTFEKWLKLPAETELKKLKSDEQNKPAFKQIAMAFDEAVDGNNSTECTS